MAVPATLQYISDIHLELRSPQQRKIPIYPPLAREHTSNDEDVENPIERRYLALCGDIGNPFQSNYRDFLALHAELYDEIFILCGNHEYYTSKKKMHSHYMVNEQTRSVCAQFDNVHFFDCDTLTLGNTTFLGCTLWAGIPEHAQEHIARNMNDYKNIYVTHHDLDAIWEGHERPEISTRRPGTLRTPHHVHPSGWSRYKNEQRRQWSVQEQCQLHAKHVRWLNETISRLTLEGSPEQTLVVLTHHAPTRKLLASAPERLRAGLRNSILDHAYATDLEELMTPPALQAWISGHTHLTKSEIVKDHCLCVSNCAGYPSAPVEGFDPTRHIKIS